MRPGASSNLVSCSNKAECLRLVRAEGILHLRIVAQRTIEDLEKNDGKKKEEVLGQEGGLIRNQNCLLAKSRPCPECFADVQFVFSKIRRVVGRHTMRCVWGVSPIRASPRPIVSASGPLQFGSTACSRSFRTLMKDHPHISRTRTRRSQ